MKEEKIDAMLHSNSFQDIINGLNLIAQYKPENSIDLILPFLEHKDLRIQDEAIYILGEVGQDNSIPYLIAIAESNINRKIRSRAMYALRKFNDKRIEKLLLRLIFEENLPLKVKRRVIESIKYYPSDTAKLRLLDILDGIELYNEVLFEAVDSIYYMKDYNIYDRLIEVQKKYDNGYISLVLKKAILEIEFELGKIESSDMLSENGNEFDQAISIWKFALDLNSEKEIELLSLFQKNEMNTVFPFGSVSMRTFIGLTIIEKGSLNVIKKLKMLIKEIWNEDEIENFEFMMDESSKLYKNYFDC